MPRVETDRKRTKWSSVEPASILALAAALALGACDPWPGCGSNEAIRDMGASIGAWDTALGGRDSTTLPGGEPMLVQAPAGPPATEAEVREGRVLARLFSSDPSAEVDTLAVEPGRITYFYVERCWLRWRKAYVSVSLRSVRRGAAQRHELPSSDPSLKVRWARDGEQMERRPERDASASPPRSLPRSPPRSLPLRPARFDGSRPSPAPASPMRMFATTALCARCGERWCR